MSATRSLAGTALVFVGMLLAGCGSDFEPPVLDTTGLPAEPLGQVLDLEVDLPNLQIPGAMFRGVELEMRFEVDEVGLGLLPARVVVVKARVDQRSAEVEDLSDGRTELFVSTTEWRPGRLGPYRIEGAAFEVMLDGTPEPGAWKVSGRSWESQSGIEGTFDGWRRHRFLVAGSDFFSTIGRVTEVAWVKEREMVVREGLELVSSDAVLRVTNRTVLAINRLTFDNLQRLDPDRAFATSWQAGIGSGSNPHDALVLSAERGYLTRYEPPFNDVAVFDPRIGTIRATIPLGELADNRDATPRADRMRMAEGVVFVGLQDIDRTFTRYGEGKLAVIDPLLDEVVGVVPLPGKNPGAIDVITGDDGRVRLYVALGGIYPGLIPGELSGGVVVVDALNRVVERVALDDDVAGGNIGAMAIASEALGYLVVSDEQFRSSVHAFDPQAGLLRRVLFETGELIPEIEIDSRGVLAVPDRSFLAPGLCLFVRGSDPTLPETPIGCASTALPPFSVEALD